MANNSGRIIDRYKSYITKSQRKKLQGMYPGYRQTTADELREQYLDNRRSMGRTGAVASAYGLGEGYIARKQADLDRVTDRYALQLGQQADASFEKEVVNQANQTIKARNEAARKAYERKVAAAKKKAAKQQADYDKALAEYNRKMQEYYKQRAYANTVDKKKRYKYDNTLNRVPVVSSWNTPSHVRPNTMGKGGIVQYTDSGSSNSGNGRPRVPAPPHVVAPPPGIQKPGQKPKGGTVQQYTDAHTGNAVIGKPTAPKYSVDNSYMNMLPPEDKAQIEANVKEVEAMKPAEKEQTIGKLTEDYLTAAANYEKSMARVNELMNSQTRAQAYMRQFKDLEAKANDTSYTPEQRRAFTQQMSGLQRQYAQAMQTYRAGSQELSGLQRSIQPAWNNLQYQRGLLGALGITMDEDEARFDVQWARNGNAVPNQRVIDLVSLENRQSDKAKEFWNRAKKITITESEGNILGGKSAHAVIDMGDEDRKWFEANGFGGVVSAVEDMLQYNTQYSSFADAANAYLDEYRAPALQYQRQRNTQVALAKFRRLSDEDKIGAVARGEEKTGLTKGLGYGRRLANSQTSVGDVLASVVGRDRSSVFVSSLLKKLDLPAGYLTKNTYGVMTDEDVLFIDYLFGIGEDQTAKDYLYTLTEWGNSIAGQKRAEAISGENAPDWVKTVRESLWQIGYGGAGIVSNMKDLFSSGERPTSEAEAAAGAITQGKVERGWTPFWAETVDSALQSAGNNAASLLLGQAIGGIGGAFGGVAGKVASHAPGAVMGLSAAGQAKQQALREGYGAKAATMYGILNGISEAVLQEKVGGLVGFGDRGVFTKALAGAVNKIGSPAARTLINQSLDILSEIGQEEFGNIFENINRSITLGEKRGLFEGVAEQAGETAVSTAISTFLLNALHIPAQIRNERGYSSIANASGMSLNDAKFLLETQDDITNGKPVDPKDLSRYNELTAVLTSSMPENVAKAIADGKMTVADWVTSNEGVVQGKLTGKLTKEERTGVQTEAVDHTETLKGKTDEQRRDYLLNAAPTGKVGSAYYTTTDGKKLEFRNLDTTQKANYVLAQKCAKAFEGSVDVVIHDTLPLSNGAMVGNDGKLHIALDTTNEQGRESIAYWTLAHEAGHALKIADSKAWNEMFGILTDYAKNYKDRDGKILYDALVDSITNQYKYDNDSDAFNDEMFSLIAERMVGSEGEQWAATLGDNTIFDAIANDRNASAKAKRGFLGKLKTSVEKLSRQFRDGGFSKERKRLAKIREQLTEAYKRINEGDSVREKYAEQRTSNRAKSKGENVSETEMASNMSEGGKVVGDLEIDNDGNVNRFSIRTTPQTEEGWDSLVNDMVAAGYTEEQAKAWIDDMRSVAAEIMDAQEFLDYENDPRSSWFRKNAEYTQGTIDFSNNCPRRAEFTAQFDALMKQFPNFAFTAEDYETIRTIIKDAGIAVTCGGCYVEERRQHLSEIGQLFLDKYHAALNGETGDNALAKKFFDKISEEDKKYDITLDDIVSSDSLRKLYDEHPTLYRAFNNFNNARGMAAARLVYGLSEYNNQIKKWNKGTITRKNNLGGLRIFSYSDADPRIILDVMQIITDSASKGLMMQGYTKKPWFAVFMKNTGVRLLRSHIPMGTGYKMVKGQMVLDFDNFEGINTKDKYYSMLDRDTDLNIGNNVIGINDTQIRLAMVSDIIDQIIPFHTGLKKSILHQKKLEGWNNYRDYQTDKAWTVGDNGEYKWRTVKKGGINLYTDIINAIDWNKTETHADGSPMTDAERFVNKYLDICREKGFKPRFAQFLCDENGNELSDYGDDHFYIEQDGKKVANPDAWYTYNPGYEKFLVDFRLFDKNGKIIEQNAVAPNFDNEFVKSLFSEYIKENPQAKPMDKGVQTKIVDAMKEKYGDELNATRHSLRATDTEYLSLAEKYRDGTATEEEKAELEKRVAEAAKSKGYKSPKLYHGTPAFGFTQIDTSAPGGDGLTFWATNKPDIAGTYSPLKKVRGIGSELNEFDYEEAFSESEAKLDDDIREFRDLVGEFFSEWFFGQQDNSYLRRQIMEANPEPGGGDGVYDVLVDIVADAYRDYGEQYQDEYDEFADFQEGFEFDQLAAVIEKLEGDRAELDDLEHKIDMSGIYELYANTDNMLELDAEGALWNNLRPSFMDKNLAHNTRRVAQWAKEHNYDGVIFRNIRDNGQYGRTGAGDVYVFFNPTAQVKSADTVTYDDNGDIIPLSERFNAENEDIRYQIRKASDLYHAEHDFSEPITTDEFRKLIAEENDTKRYFPKGLPKDFLKTISRKSLFTAPKLYRGIDAAEFDYLVDNGYLKSNGSYNFANQRGQTLADEDASYALSYATGFAPKPIADRHYRGDMLPTYLIEFINSPDLRMTKNQTQESYTEGKIDQKYITRVFEINYDPNTKKDMIHDITGDASTRSMLPNIGEGLSGYAHGEPVFFRDPNTGTILYAVQDEYGKESGRYVSEKMPDVTFSIGDTAAFNEAGMEQYFGVTVADDTELERMKVDEDGNLVPASDSPRYQQRDFRIDFNVPQLDTKALHEAVKGGEGTVENRFEVKYEKTDSGFAVHITDKDSGKTYDRAETVTEGNAKAEAERAAAAVIRNIKRGEQRKAFREYADKREADARLAERMHEGAIRARIERKANETEAEYKARIKKIYEDRYRREIKNTALKWNKKLVDMLARPTENKHVPVQLARSVAEFCEEVTQYLDGTTKRGEKMLDKIRKAYDRAFTDEQTIIRAKSEDAGYDARGAVLNTSQKDEQLAEMLKELSDITAEKSFAELTRDEMDALLNVVRGVAYAVTDANKLIGEAEGKTVWQTGSTMIEQLENAPKVSAKLRGYLATSLDLRRLARIFSGSNDDAEFVKLVEQLNQGAIEKERVAQELQAIFKPVTDEYGDEIRKWYGKKAEWINTGIIGKDGLPVKITKGMRVSLALHVLNEGNMRHIERGGLTIPEAKLYAQGKLADAYANGKLERLTAEQINDIIANMTEAEKAYVEAAKQLFHDRAGFYVNKTSLQLAGYTKANVENYFPIHTDKNFNKTDFASMSMDGSIEGQGFLKERVAASNPVYLEDITSVVNRQIRGVALYAGMAIPVRNFNAVMNAAAYEDENGNWVPRTTVKQTLAKTMGEYGAKVVEGFVEDASEMSQRVDVTPVERIAGKLSTNYVKAVLLGNLKVAMKQVASYPTAAAVIPWKYLNKALVAGGRNHRIISRADVDLINKYTPLYQMRREGNANEVASLMNKPGMEQKLPWLLGWITKMDVMTVGRLWSAAEYMVEDTHKDLTKGSDEFYREVAKVFNQTIQQTQPNFTPLQRSAALRSKNPIVRSLTLFGTQRMQNGGILIEAAYELKQAKGKSAEEIAAARRKLGRAVASQVTQNLLLLLATIAVDALRGRMKSWQDDDDELTLESVGKKMGDTFLSNILGSFLGGSEFYETISNMYKKANGQTTYDTEFSVPALDAIDTIMSFGQSGIPNFINYLNGEHTDEEKLNKLKSFSTELAKVAGYATGLPLENAVKDVFKGFYPAYKDIRDWRRTGELIPYLWQSGKLGSAKTRARYEDWIDSGHKGSEFFALDKQLKNAVGGRDGRAEILWNESSLSPEDKAKLMEMYDTSDGYAEGSKFLNKNGKELYDFAAEPAQETEAPAETPAEEVAEIPAATSVPAASEAPAATTAPKSDKYTKAAEKWAAYGVTASQAKSAVEAWEKAGNASDYRAWLSKQNYTGRQKFAMYAQANADTEKKAVDFNKKYGIKFEALWDAYTKYDSNSFHGEDYRTWVEKQTSDYRQRFSLVEFAEPRSNWIEHAEELHKAGVSYEAVWKAARYAKNQSGTGKKDRIIAYAKKLGMSTKQAENIYKWFG